MNASEHTHDLLTRGIAAAKANENAEAQRYLEWLLRLDPTMEQRIEALLWLARVCSNPAEQRQYVEEALAYNPADMRGRRLLAVLNGQLKTDEMVDPDRLQHPTPAADAQKTGAERFVCPQCGGRMTFTPDGSGLTCEYCEASAARRRTQAGSDAAAAENFLIAMATRKGHIHPVDRQTFNCQGCGVAFILSAEQLTATCPYCGSAYVIQQAENRELIDPTLIYPFRVSESQARQGLRAWFGKSGLALDEISQVERGVGIYLPTWSFEMAGEVPWNCEIQASRDRWVPQTGREIVYHTGVLVPAGQHLTAECAAELTSFDIRQATAFDESYLAAWPAETYSVAVGDASLEARRWTFEFEKQSVRDRFLQPVRNLNFQSTSLTIESFQLVLLPVWVSTFHLKRERYQVVINGHTGAVRGQRPLNWLERILSPQS